MPTTLLVEDNAVFRELIRETLLDNFPSMTVREAHNSSSAIHAVQESMPDLIFMDINLGGESGLDLTKEIKNDYPGMEIVVLPASDVDEFREAALAAGASIVLVKSTMVEYDVLQVVNNAAFSRQQTERPAEP